MFLIVFEVFWVFYWLKKVVIAPYFESESGKIGQFDSFQSFITSEMGQIDRYKSRFESGFWSQSGIYIEKVKFKMVDLNFRKVLRSLFFLACLSFVLWQCYLLMGKFLERPRSTSVGFDQAKNWPMPKFVMCPAIKSFELMSRCDFETGFG